MFWLFIICGLLGLGVCFCLLCGCLLPVFGLWFMRLLYLRLLFGWGWLLLVGLLCTAFVWVFCCAGLFGVCGFTRLIWFGVPLVWAGAGFGLVGGVFLVVCGWLLFDGCFGVYSVTALWQCGLRFCVRVYCAVCGGWVFCGLLIAGLLCWWLFGFIAGCL